MEKTYRRRRLHFGVAKFFLYILFCLTACNFPFVIYGLILGAPAVCIASLFLAIKDAMLVDPNNIPEVFTRKVLFLWIIELAVAILLIFSLLLIV